MIRAGTPPLPPGPSGGRNASRPASTAEVAGIASIRKTAPSCARTVVEVEISGTFDLVLSEAQLWTDLVLPPIEHLSDPAQIDLGVVASAFLEVVAATNSIRDRRVVADFDAQMMIRIESSPVPSRWTTWSRLEVRSEN